MFRNKSKILFALVLAILLFTSLHTSAHGLDSFASSNSNSNSNSGNENYYRELAQLISSTWDDAFFGMATMSVGSETLEVDNETIRLDNPAEIVDGELVLPLEALQEIGVQISSDARGASMNRKGKSIEVTYGDKSMRVNGSRKGMPASAALRNGKPVVPAIVLAEDGLDFELDFDEKTGKVVITNEYQMARVIAKARPGKTLPKDVNVLKTIIGPDGLYVFQYSSEDQAKGACEHLNGLPDVLYAEPDFIVTLNSGAANAESADPPASYPHLGWGPGRIASDSYLDYLVAGGKQGNPVDVAVLDTGLDATHPLFSNRHVPGYSFTNANANDVHGHGTHVAGTVLDVAAALQNVKIMPVKVLGDNGKGAALGIAEGVRWAVDNGAKVINMSLGEMVFGSQGCLELMHDNIDDAASRNVTVVVAAGNGGANADSYCPAHVESAITVAASDSEDKPASFSNYGSSVDVAAPGVGIISAAPGGGTSRMSGTSMASPHVAGAIALLYCDNPNMTSAAAKAAIRSSVDPISLYNGRYYGSGILNMGKAVGATSYIGITPAYIELICNATQQLDTQQLAVEYYVNGAIADAVSQPAFSTSVADVASVSATGLVTAKSSGIAAITATMEGKTAICIVSVTENNASFDGAISIAAGVSITVPVTAPRQIRYYKFIPAASGHHIIESANPVDSTDPYGYLYNENMRLIDQNDDGAGNKNFRISCSLTAGQTYYIGAACNGTGTGSYTFSVAPPILPTSITVSPAEAELNVSETLRLAATILPLNATDSAVKWASSDSSVATVSSTGLVTAVAAGIAIITAETANGLKASCAVIVRESNIDFGNATTVIANTTVPVSITDAKQIRYYKFVPAVSGFHIIESANPVGRTDPYGYLYNASEAQIASDDDGVGNRNFRVPSNLTAGQTYYIGAACYGTEIGSYTFSIMQPALPTSITVSPIDMELDINETRRELTATVLPHNATDRTVRWTSSNIDVALVDARGGVLPRSAGTAIITAETSNGLKATCSVTVAVTNATFDGAAAIAADVSVPISITAVRQIRYYKFIPTTSGNYTIESSSPVGNADPYGYLYNANKAQIASDDDGAGNRNFRISFNLVAGQTYYIGAACYSTGVGSYAISVKRAAPPTPPEGKTLLSISNAKYGRDDQAKTHAIQASSTGIITLSLTGAKNDSYTVSLRKNGVELATSDSNRVVSLSYRIVEAGAYEIIVEKTSAINGLFSLTVTQE